MAEPKFFSVFFDLGKPQTRQNALVLKVDKNKFANLLDECVPDKTVELKFTDGVLAKYTIEQRSTFWTNEFGIIEGQESNCFIICYVKKYENKIK